MTKSIPDQNKIEINNQFRTALEILENSRRSLFITGRAGTGKSTLLDYFRNHTAKKVAVLAPTGVAALNVKGQTIHSFFGFKPNITLQMIRKLNPEDPGSHLYRQLDTIIIDEISMVRADLLDCVDAFLRLNGKEPDQPFGGIQMVFIGDLYQLPPVLTSAEKTGFNLIYPSPYFYSSKVFESFDMEFIELEKIYRQHDLDFIELLNAIRNRSVTEEHLEKLNSRYKPDFEPSPDDFFVYLTTTNALAKEINQKQLNKLKSRAYTFRGEINGEFGNEYLPTDIELTVKKGAQVMLLNNDAEGRWVNGSVGEILQIIAGDTVDPVIIVKLAEGDEVEVMPYTWEIFRLRVEDGVLHSEVTGTFRQFPLMLAWAITIHKSQGKTFERVIIDIGKGTFAHGQLYVALSRCRSLEGIILKKPIQKKHILTDFQVVEFLTRYQYRKAEEQCSLSTRIELIQAAIRENRALEIVYLKPNDEKTHRKIIPISIGEMTFQGKTYTGVRAFCLIRNSERTFRIDRILEIRKV